TMTSVVEIFFFFFSSRRRHTRFSRDWSSDVCSSDLFRKLVWIGWRSEKALSLLPKKKKIPFQIIKQSQKRLWIYFLKEIWKRKRSEERRVGKECRSRW